MEAAGDVSDFDASTRAAISSAFASQCGAGCSGVLVAIVPASVLIRVTLTYERAASANAAKTSILTTLNSPSRATSFLSAAAVAIVSAPAVTVVAQTTPAAPAASPPPSPPPAESPAPSPSPPPPRLTGTGAAPSPSPSPRAGSIFGSGDAAAAGSYDMLYGSDGSYGGDGYPGGYPGYQQEALPPASPPSPPLCTGHELCGWREWCDHFGQCRDCAEWSASEGIRRAINGRQPRACTSDRYGAGNWTEAERPAEALAEVALHLGRAETLADELANATARARLLSSLAAFVGIQPWELTVRRLIDGGGVRSVVIALAEHPTPPCDSASAASYVDECAVHAPLLATLFQTRACEPPEAPASAPELLPPPDRWILATAPNVDCDAACAALNETCAARYNATCVVRDGACADIVLGSEFGFGWPHWPRSGAELEAVAQAAGVWCASYETTTSIDDAAPLIEWERGATTSRCRFSRRQAALSLSAS